MPAAMLDTWRPSECPLHGTVHAIWLDGHNGRWSAYRERRRYTCVRFDETGARRTHRFTAAGAVPDSSGGDASADRTSEPGADEELAVEVNHAAPASTFTIPEIARLLIAVGEGKPLRGCAEALRKEARRRHCEPNLGRVRPRLEVRRGGLSVEPLVETAPGPVRPAGDAAGGIRGTTRSDRYNYSAPKPARRVDSSRSASTAMDYVDQYAPAVLEWIAPERWPVYVALGTVAVPGRGRSQAFGASAGECRGEVMVAADCETPGRGYAFHARFGAGRDRHSWIDFLGTLAGSPAWIVAAPEDGLAEAVSELWPGTTLFACENHLRDDLRAAARRDLVPERTPERGPVFDEARGALRDTERWQDLLDAVDRLPPSRSANLRAWVEDHEALVLTQLLLKKRHRTAPTDDGALDTAREEIRDGLFARSGLVRNLWRLNLRLALMSAHWSELDHEREYIAALDRHLAGPADPARGRRRAPRRDWASGRDFGGARSIDDFLATADARRVAADADRRAGAASGLTPVDLDARNRARDAVGLPRVPERPVALARTTADLGAGLDAGSVAGGVAGVAGRARRGTGRAVPAGVRAIGTVRGPRSAASTKARRPAGRATSAA
jgi:hypothetical protein